MARLKDLGISTATAFRATALPAVGALGAAGPAAANGPGRADAADGAGSTVVTADIPARAWDLSGLRDRYQEFTEFAGLLRDQTVAGEITTADALVARTRVMNEWRAFPAMDPDLPYELLPPAWPRAAARDLFITCYDLLGPLAARRVRQIIARYSPELAGRAAYHSSALTLSSAED
jgi:phenylacetic acid degradation operon negative regulatory protein